MATKSRSYSVFWALLSKMPGNDGDLKEQLVSAASESRTDSLKELTDREYSQLIGFMADSIGKLNKNKPATDGERRLRSVVLKLLDKLGIHVINNDWSAVNTFLLNPRISGRLLYEMNEDELGVLIRKLNSIADKNSTAGQLPYDINKICTN